MADLNRVFIAGRLTRDPELRYTASGQAVTDLSIATGRTYLTKTGEKKEETTYVDVVVWGRQAETSSEYLGKGSSVLIEGRLQLDSWETKEGEKRNRLRVQASRVQFIGRPMKSKASSGENEASEKKKSVVETAVEDDIPF